MSAITTYHSFRDTSTRDLNIFRGKKLTRSKWRLANMTLKGSGLLDNLTVSTSDHTSMFYSSADWLVRHQDVKGGWPIQVRRKMASGLIDLAPGWYSAMGQGQAMSLLMRAFNQSGSTPVSFLFAANCLNFLFHD